MRIFALFVPVIATFEGFPASGPARAQDCAEILIMPEYSSGSAAGRGTGVSLSAALVKLREWRLADPNMRICLTFQSGTYQLNDTLRIGLEESGGPQAATILRRFDSGEVILSGGISLEKHWRQADGLWIFEVGELCGSVPQRSLFVNGVRRTAVRAPSSGFYSIAGERPRRKEGNTWLDEFQFGDDLKPEALALNANSELVAYHFWSASRHGVRSIDAANKTITLNGLTSHTDDWARYARSEKYYLLNVRSGTILDGQWIQEGDRIEYRPTAEELKALPTRTPSLILPCLPRLVHISNGAHDIRVEGLTFAYTGDRRRGYGITPAQAGVGPETEAAVAVQSAARVAFRQVKVRATASFAFWLDRNTRSASIVDSEIHDLGGGAVMIGDPVTAYTPIKEQVDIRSDDEIGNNRIYDGGKIREDSVAIWIGDVGGNRIDRNIISNFEYSALSVGWNWGGMQLSRGNTIEDNSITQIGLGGLSDLGGIYTLGDLSGTVIRNNRISDITASRYGGFGIYLDRESSGIDVSNNRVSATRDAPIALHFAYRNRIAGNSLCPTAPPSILVIKPGKSGNTIGDNECSK